MKTLKWVLIAVIGVPIVFVVGVFIRNKSIGPEGWARDNTVAQLARQMKDPDSMVIRSSFVVKTKKDGAETIAICGIVDGKNSFGGFTGGSRFMSRSVHHAKHQTFDTYDVQIEDPEQKRVSESVHRLSSFELVYWNQYCVDEAHPPIQPPST